MEWKPSRWPRSFSKWLLGDEGARLVPPVHLEPEVLDYLTERASARGVSLSSLVNTLLKKDIELIDAGK
jgi:hypothetical protein